MAIKKVKFIAGSGPHAINCGVAWGWSATRIAF